MAVNPVTGLPGVRSDRDATYRKVFASDQNRAYMPGGKIIDGSLARDIGNTGDLDVLRAGVIMGRITASGKFAPSMIGQTGAAYSSGVTLTLTAATVTEIARRIGSSGTFTIAGPATAGGTMQTESVTFSALPTATTATVSALTNDYVSGSLITADDGSEDMLSFIPDGYGLKVTDQDDADIDVPFPEVPVSGVVDASQLLIWPSDTSIRQWILDQLNVTSRFVFDHLF